MSQLLTKTKKEIQQDPVSLSTITRAAMAVNDDQFEKYVMGDAKNPPIEKDAEGDSAHSLGSGGGEDTAYTSASASANKGLVR